MKKPVLLLLTLVPIVAGYLINSAILLTEFGMFLFYLLPVIILAFWFWLGFQFRSTSWNIVQSAIIAHLLGVVALVLYYKEFIFTAASDRNFTLAVFSQMYSVTLSPLTARLAILFEMERNTISQTTTTAMQWIGLIFMVLVFVGGYVYGESRATRSPADRRLSSTN